MIKNLEKIFTDSQSEIIKSFTDLEKSKHAKIVCDSWKRPEGGGHLPQVFSCLLYTSDAADEL